MNKRLISIMTAGIVSASVLTGCGSGSTATADAGATASTTAASTEAGAASGTTEAAETTTGTLQPLRVAVMTGQLDHYATAIGKWQGIFEEHGIDLEVTEFVYGINTIDAVVNDLADVGNMADYATVNRLGNTLGATNLKIFSQLSGGGTAQSGGLYVAPQYADDLDALDGSEGFMYSAGTVTYYYASQCIDYLGLDESKQNLINTDSSQTRLALIEKGDASAYYASGSEANYIEDAGWQLVATSEDIGITTGSYFLATDEFIAENKDLLAEFLLAVDESTTYINEHLDESAEYLETELGIKAEDFKANWVNYTFEPGFPEEAAVHLEDIEQWAYAHGSFDTDYSIRDFIDTEVVEIAFPDNVTIVQ